MEDYDIGIYPMRFEEIPKRSEKMLSGKQNGFWYRFRKMTNSLGDSAFMSLVITLSAPIIMRSLSVLILMGSYLTSGVFEAGWFFEMIVFTIMLFIVQELLVLTTYGYLLYIAYHQIRYDINRWTGIATVSIILFSLPAFMIFARILMSVNLT